ncbi:hypothetical protein BHE74_00050393 [Ensete ventricosum]|nr:hypothetical protein BHE74_00050393 [Ensete ventricosum]
MVAISFAHHTFSPLRILLPCTTALCLCSTPLLPSSGPYYLPHLPSYHSPSPRLRTIALSLLIPTTIAPAHYNRSCYLSLQPLIPLLPPPSTSSSFSIGHTRHRCFPLPTMPHPATPPACRYCPIPPLSFPTTPSSTQPQSSVVTSFATTVYCHCHYAFIGDDVVSVSFQRRSNTNRCRPSLSLGCYPHLYPFYWETSAGRSYIPTCQIRMEKMKEVKHPPL